MALLSRKKPRAAPAEPVVLTKAGGKGRPTPTRSAARASRPVEPYLTLGKGGKGGGKGRGGAKAGRRREADSTRAALKGEGSGPLPRRDAAPERGLTRQVVDGRRNLMTLVFVVYLLFFASSLVPGRVSAALFSLMLVLLLVVLADAFLLVRLVRRTVRAAYPDSTLSTGLYAVQRALLPRRFRLPRPGVGVPGPSRPAPR